MADDGTADGHISFEWMPVEVLNKFLERFYSVLQTHDR